MSVTTPPMSDVTLVIPARNASRTLRQCLAAVQPMLSSGRLREIIVVDDGSTDDTAAIAQEFGVTVLHGQGQGPGHARNIGWQHATTDLIWFIDSDCVAESDALELLLPHLQDPQVAGVGGSYGNMCPDSWLAGLIHEEIIARHRRMPAVVNFLATFNVLYRRSVLKESGGFDESFKLAQDAELAYRLRKAGHHLRFEFRSRVRHFHPTNLWRYLRTQARQGYYRMKLYRRYPIMASGDHYSCWIDHIQPLLALLLVIWMPALCLPYGWLGAILIGGFLICSATMSAVTFSGRASNYMTYLYVPFSLARSFLRAAGAVLGVCSHFSIQKVSDSEIRAVQEVATP